MHLLGMRSLYLHMPSLSLSEARSSMSAGIFTKILQRPKPLPAGLECHCRTQPIIKASGDDVRLNSSISVLRCQHGHRVPSLSSCQTSQISILPAKDNTFRMKAPFGTTAPYQRRTHLKSATIY